MTTLLWPTTYRHRSVFDRFNELLQVSREEGEQSQNAPAYNIDRVDEENYAVTLAVPGYQRAELGIEVREGWLQVTGDGTTTSEQESIHRGISSGKFQRRFKLGQHIEIDGASLDSGLLTIRLKQVVPENMRPRTIDISENTASIGHASGAGGEQAA